MQALLQAQIGAFESDEESVVSTPLKEKVHAKKLSKLEEKRDESQSEKVSPRKDKSKREKSKERRKDEAKTKKKPTNDIVVVEEKRAKE